MQDTAVQSLGWEDALKKGKATLSTVLAWRIPWTEEPGRLQSVGSQESDTTEQLSLSCCHRSSRTTAYIFKYGFVFILFISNTI